jgi:hypothetical protein
MALFLKCFHELCVKTRVLRQAREALAPFHAPLGDFLPLSDRYLPSRWNLGGWTGDVPEDAIGLEHRGRRFVCWDTNQGGASAADGTALESAAWWWVSVNGDAEQPAFDARAEDRRDIAGRERSEGGLQEDVGRGQARAQRGDRVGQVGQE